LGLRLVRNLERWHKRLVLTGFIALAAASPAATSRMLLIPGPVRSILAPDGSGARIFYRPRMSPDGGQWSPVFYDDGQGHIQQISTLQRNMGISWSQDGKSAFLQDNWGSNIADCYVLSRVSGSVKGASLSKLIQRTPGHPSRVERQGHYYVHCDRWHSPEQIVGAVSGHTDTNPGHGFNHPFIYNARTHQIVWR
jgi:hypothetical protein